MLAPARRPALQRKQNTRHPARREPNDRLHGVAPRAAIGRRDSGDAEAWDRKVVALENVGGL
jgi:hypothetical protein